MKKNESPTHAYVDAKGELTLERLDAFALESRLTQLLVLAILRRRSVEDSIQLPLYALALTASLAIIAGMFVTEPSAEPLWARAIAAGVVGLVVGVVIALIVGLPAYLAHNRRVAAVAWLAAYEDELARRRIQRGRAARAWRANH